MRHMRRMRRAIEFPVSASRSAMAAPLTPRSAPLVRPFEHRGIRETGQGRKTHRRPNMGFHGFQNAYAPGDPVGHCFEKDWKIIEKKTVPFPG